MSQLFVPSQAYDATYTNIVDYDATTGNLLFRGNLPILPTCPHLYAYHEMNRRMQQLIANLPPSDNAPQNFDLKNYNLLDINLLDNQGDYVDWSLVFAAFGANRAVFPQSDWPPYENSSWSPQALLGNDTVLSASNVHAGNMVWWPFEPDFNESSGGFQFNELVTFANTQLTTQPAQGANPMVIYVHCDSGVNRTGTFTVSYLLAYGSNISGPCSSLESAYQTADAMVPQNQAPASTYFPMITQYCDSLPNSDNLGCTYQPS